MSPRAALLGLLLALPVLVVAPPAQAQPAPAPVMPTSVPARVDVTVRVIEASSKGTRVDPRLAAQAASLKSTPFTAFQLLDEQRFKLPDGRSAEVVLRDGRRVTLTLRGHDTRAARVHVAIHRGGPERVETDLTVARDRAYMYVLRTAEAGVSLLLEVDVAY
ncbi:MAG: hypothetical protein KC656_23855 [Myxococcales bacterium]|nr:hypothetical protein [Myxococcales bacterium]MCB9663487.1 hypothetical protein [Alphaproteobacteria bacterium]